MTGCTSPTEHGWLSYDINDIPYVVLSRIDVAFPQEFYESLSYNMRVDVNSIYDKETLKKINLVKVCLPPNPNVVPCNDEVTHLNMYVRIEEKTETHKTKVVGWAWKQDLYNGGVVITA